MTGSRRKITTTKMKQPNTAKRMCDEVNWAISDEVTHWAEIPLPPVEKEEGK
jgi:hypothetical protein